MRFVALSLPCLSLILAGCSTSYNAPKATTPTPAPTPTAATPTFSVGAGTYTSAQTVTISDATSGATIYYTTNGTAPSATLTAYTAPITVSTTETLMAAAIAPAYALSAVASAAYLITPPPPPKNPDGTVRHGQAAIAAAHVYLLAANTTGYGNASVSLLDAAATGASDAIGAFVTTGSDGSFDITGDYSCTANTQVYVYALGGDAGSGNNIASGLLAVLGNCPSSGAFSFPSTFVVNEATTVAAAYAMAGFATDATHMSSSGTALAQAGIANAFGNAANLANISTGAALATTASGGAVPQNEINTLANILAGCVGSANSGSCSSLFQTATSDGTATGAQPTDTATAAINIAHHPGLNVAALYALTGGSSAFTPVLAAQPNDFTVALLFTVPNEGTSAGPDGAHPIAIDGDDSVWVLANTVFKLSSSGAFLSPSGGYTGGGVSSPRSIAIDQSGNAWIANYLGGQEPTGGVTELSSTGAALSPSTGFVSGTSLLGYTVAIDASGNAWLPYGDGVANLSSSGSFIIAVANPPGASLGIGGIAVDAGGNIWGAVPYGATLFNEFSSSGAIVNPPTAGQFSCGAPFFAEQQPEGVAVDATGDIWITSGQGVTKEAKSPIPACSGTGGGIVPAAEGVGGDIAIDGDGDVWVVSGGALSELSNSGAPISPSTGYQAPGAVPFSVALDGSGNVWATGTNGNSVGNLFSLNVLEYIGASAPVVTPISAGVKSNTLGSRP